MQSAESACVHVLQGRAQVDLTILVFGSLSELHSHDEVLGCLRSVHNALHDDGLFILEFTHPREIFASEGFFFEVCSPCM